MLYHLFYPLRDIISFFNIFRYITFRAGLAAVTTFLLCLIFGPFFIKKLKQWKIQEIAKKIHVLIGERGVSRSDFILRGSIPYFLEINTIPGMTKTSLVPQSAEKAGLTFRKLLDQLIAYAQDSLYKK